jgi:hypothetical protein
LQLQSRFFAKLVFALERIRNVEERLCADRVCSREPVSYQGKKPISVPSRSELQASLRMATQESRSSDLFALAQR